MFPLFAVMIAMAVLFWMLEQWQDKHRCYYCDAVNKHEEHCPFNHEFLQ